MKKSKKELRADMKKRRDLLLPEEVLRLSNQIARRVTSSDIFAGCQHICIYRSFRNEVCCDAIADIAFAAGKHVYVPVTNRDRQCMEFYEVTRETEWNSGAYGIEEPVLDEHAVILEDDALILMPGLLFDRHKHRIGYGGGYYDRYLKEHETHCKMALAFSFQVSEELLPFEEFDVAPDYIVTEQEIF